MANEEQQLDFGDVKQRLEQIADAVSDEDLSLDQALDLFEEAVSLSMQAGGLLEVGVDEVADSEASDDVADASSVAADEDGVRAE